MQSEIKANYHQKWLEEKANSNQDKANEKIFNTLQLFFKKIVKKDLKGKFLDLGCGDGSFFNYCKKQGLDAQGIDLTDGVDFEKDVLPYDSEQFDFIMLYSVIEHLFDPSNILNEVKRILKPHGIVFFITPNIDRCGSQFYDDHTHIRPYNPKGINRLMQSFDFKKEFIGLWTAGKGAWVWKIKPKFQFLLGVLLPFSGRNKLAPAFLKGKSTTMLCVFSKK